MSSENRKGNPLANHCARHGDFIGGRCPVCEGANHGSPAGRRTNKAAYRTRIEHGLQHEEDAGW